MYINDVNHWQAWILNTFIHENWLEIWKKKERASKLAPATRQCWKERAFYRLREPHHLPAVPTMFANIFFEIGICLAARGPKLPCFFWVFRGPAFPDSRMAQFFEETGGNLILQEFCSHFHSKKSWTNSNIWIHISPLWFLQQIQNVSRRNKADWFNKKPTTAAMIIKLHSEKFNIAACS